MAIGMQDPVIVPTMMKNLCTDIRGCPTPLEMAETGHFVQEYGDIVVKKALESFINFLQTRA